MAAINLLWIVPLCLSCGASAGFIFCGLCSASAFEDRVREAARTHRKGGESDEG